MILSLKRRIKEIFKTFPKEYRENLAWRRKILLRSKLDPAYQAKVKELFHRDILFAFNAFFYTFDVRRRPFHHQPFCTYLFQDEVLLKLVAHIDRGEDCPIEKSRDMGVSWMIIMVFVWFWLKPEGGTDFLLGSRIEDYVDKKGDMRTLMEKARYALRRLPKFLRPKGFSFKKHDNYMRLQNPETGSSITGESNNENFSTGGRYLAILFDEFAKWKLTDKSAWADAGDATPCRIPNSTPFGAAGQYYDLVTDPAKEKIRLHWSLHPIKAKEAYCNWPRRKDDEDFEEEEDLERLIRSPWYDKECQRRSALEIAQNLDIDYIGAGNPVFDGKAGKRVGTLLRIARKPHCFKDFNLGELKLEEIPEVRDSGGFLIVFKEPEKRTGYALGIDVVEGVEGGDYCVVKILNRTTKDCDATYYSQISEVELARVIKIIADYYTTFDAPWVGIETNGPGLATFDIAVEMLDVDNLFMMPTYDSAKASVSFKKGWRTTTASRNTLISGIKDWLLEKAGWGDKRLCREFTTFVRNKNGKAEAKAGTNDDEVIAWGIAIQVDAMAPLGDYVEKVEKREDGISFSIHNPFAYPIEGEPKTVEERCMATVMKKVEEKKQLGIYENVSSIPYYGLDQGWD